MLSRCEAASDKLTAEVLSSTEEYVPFRTGRLMMSGHVETDGKTHSTIVYSVPYAAECYYADHPFNKTYHKLATARWFEAAKSAHLDSWINTVKRELISQ